MGITAADLMTKKVITLTPDMNLVEMDTVLLKRGVSGAPVVERRQLVGVASQVDIIRAVWEGHHEAHQHPPYYSSLYPIPLSAIEYMAKDAPQLAEQLTGKKVRDIMTTDPLVAHPDDPIEKIAERMVSDQIHRLPIIDPDSGDLVGLISSLDLVRAISIHGLAEVF